MGNVIITPQEQHRRFQQLEERNKQLEIALRYLSAMNSAAQPVAPNLSYDELVVAEANRRIQAEKQQEIALAEKKRFEEDVAEKIALAKDPNHVTRAMIEEYNKPENVKAREDAAIEKNKLQIMEMWYPSHLNLSDADRNKLDKLKTDYDRLFATRGMPCLRGTLGPLKYQLYGKNVTLINIIKKKNTIHESYTDRLYNEHPPASGDGFP